MINFCYDDLGEFGIGYPNLAQKNLAPDQFDNTWPRSIPIRLLVYFESESIPNQAHLVGSAPVGSWYPIAWSWHDFDCDYIGLLAPATRERLRAREIRLLFYYHEGDNPSRIIDHLKARCRQHAVPEQCFVLVSANSAAEELDQGFYFPDHEYFFRWLNMWQPYQPFLIGSKNHWFTALNRTHKQWRAMIMADLVRSSVLDGSQWSYNTEILLEENEDENPLEWNAVPGWKASTDNFLANGPYFCDEGDAVQHNDHTQVNLELYSNSYLHLVIETLLDADGSGGVFLTEKTYKCIKYGQPFIILGTPGSLARLKSDGYRTFEHVIDPSYDNVINNTKRYLAVKKILQQIRQMDPQRFLEMCQDDIRYNQEIFMCHRSLGLGRLIDRLNRSIDS